MAVSMPFCAEPETTPLGPSEPSSAQEKAQPPKAYDMLRMDGERIITEEEHFGITNGLLTAGINYRDVGTLSGLYAPPFASSDFMLQLRCLAKRCLPKSTTGGQLKSVAKGASRNYSLCVDDSRVWETRGTLSCYSP